MSRGRAQRLVVGIHPVRELLRALQHVDEVLLDEDRRRTDEIDDLVALAEERGVAVHEVPRSRIDDLAEGLVHQGVVAHAPPFPYADLDDLLGRIEGRPALLVVLDGITDPHNLGSIARTAESVGAHGLIIPQRRAAHVTPVVEKAAAGALAHLALVRVVNLARALRSLGAVGIWTMGLDADAPSTIYDSPLLTEPLALVIGSEGRGLARSSHVQCDVVVSLPQRGRIGSLNASVAAAAALYEVDRRRSRS